jgi:hypothetical protein
VALQVRRPTVSDSLSSEHPKHPATSKHLDLNIMDLSSASPLDHISRVVQAHQGLTFEQAYRMELELTARRADEARARADAYDKLLELRRTTGQLPFHMVCRSLLWLVLVVVHQHPCARCAWRIKLCVVSRSLPLHNHNNNKRHH